MEANMHNIATASFLSDNAANIGGVAWVLNDLAMKMHEMLDIQGKSIHEARNIIAAGLATHLYVVLLADSEENNTPMSVEDMRVIVGDAFELIQSGVMRSAGRAN